METTEQVKVEQVKEPDPVAPPRAPTEVVFTSKLPLRTSRNRNSFDEDSLQAKLRYMNRTYGARKPKRIIRTTNMKPVQDTDEHGMRALMLVTDFIIMY